jgi:peptidoglycan/LPS O-acetylase OafA/YrhL
MVYSVQYLRGFAALLVVLSHVLTKTTQLSGYTADWFSIGPAGVDLFFIISGFIMCKATEGKSISPASFMVARVKRIIPLYWSLSFIALSIFLVRPELVNSSGGTTTVLHSFTLIPTGEKLLIQNGWTLSFEFLFYAIFALSIAANSKEKIRGSIISLCALSFIGLIIEPDSPGLKFITSTLLFEFVMGMAAYLYLKNYSNHKIMNAAILLFGIISLCMISQYDHSLNRVVSFGLPMLAIFIGFVSFESAIEKVSDKKIMTPIKALGDSSYSLYLIHPFALALTAVILRKLQLADNLSIASVSLISTAILSGYVCYAFLEMPLNKLFKGGRRSEGSSTTAA